VIDLTDIASDDLKRDLGLLKSSRADLLSKLHRVESKIDWVTNELGRRTTALFDISSTNIT
jgi:hypothetical protein